MKKTTPVLDPSLEIYVNALLEKKTRNVVVLDLGELSSVADVFIIGGATSSRQVTAIADHVKVALKKHGKIPLNTEGVREGLWALLDYGHVVFHIFYEPTREFYDLESLWIDAERIDIPGSLEAVDD